MSINNGSQNIDSIGAKRVTIAKRDFGHFFILKWLGGFIFFATMLALSVYVPYASGNFWSTIELHCKIFILFSFIAWCLGPVMLYMLLLVFWQICFNKARAVWVIGGRLVYLNGFRFSIPLNEIDSVEEGNWGDPPKAAIILRMRGGMETRTIPAERFSESTSMIVKRLRGFLVGA
jgi:hypothetical protein